VTEPNEVLWHLVDRKVPDIAALYITKSEARDTSKHSTEWNESLSTLWIAACNGYAQVVRALIDRGTDIDKPRASNGCTPLYVASERVMWRW
jgi:ankyrin repeat protein